MDFATQQELRRGKAEERFLELRRSELEAEGGVFGKERLTLASFDGVKMSYTIEDVRRGYRAVGNSAKKIINNFLAGASLKNDQAAVEMMLEQIIAEESSPDALAQEVSARLERLQISEVGFPFVYRKHQKRLPLMNPSPSCSLYPTHQTTCYHHRPRFLLLRVWRRRRRSSVLSVWNLEALYSLLRATRAINFTCPASRFTTAAIGSS